jgi:hypothetical protein
MSISKKRRAEINRANAQKSTGPKTEAGKARSRANAFRHGLTGQYLIMHAGDFSGYQASALDQIHAFRPVGLHETRLVQFLIDAAWQIDRANALEINARTLESLPLFNLQTPEQKEANAELDPAAAACSDHVMNFWAPTGDDGKEVRPAGAKNLEWLGRHRARIERSFHKTREQLMKLQEIRLKAVAAAHALADSKKEAYDPAKHGPFDNWEAEQCEALQVYGGSATLPLKTPMILDPDVDPKTLERYLSHIDKINTPGGVGDGIKKLKIIWGDNVTGNSEVIRNYEPGPEENDDDDLAGLPRKPRQSPPPAAHPPASGPAACKPRNRRKPRTRSRSKISPTRRKAHPAAGAKTNPSRHSRLSRFFLLFAFVILLLTAATKNAKTKPTEVNHHAMSNLQGNRQARTAPSGTDALLLPPDSAPSQLCASQSRSINAFRFSAPPTVVKTPHFSPAILFVSISCGSELRLPSLTPMSDHAIDQDSLLAI